MPSDMDAVIEEFTVEDAELVVRTLRQRAAHVDPGAAHEVFRYSAELAARLRLIANHLAMEAGKVRMKAEQVST